jgi:putative flavoprotein involved in K+ transport
VAPDRNDAVVVGGGAAGLATAAMLRTRGLSPVVLEQGEKPGWAWRSRYERLRLHTSRGLSGLPGYRIPRSFGRWVSRDGVADYLERYAAHHELDLRLRTRADRIEPADGGWVVQTSAGPLRAPLVVVATGFSNEPFLPDWPGRDGFRGELVHSSSYRNAEPFRGRDVLVVGSGNSGAEIAVDLADGRASRVRIAIRTPPHIVRRDALGVPSQALGIFVGALPPSVGGALAAGLRRLTIPDLSAFGLQRPAERLAAQFARTGTVPILDVGFVAAVLDRRVEIVAAVEAFDGASVVLADGSRIEPEVVLAATGFRAGLEPLVGHLGVLDGAGLPRSDEPLPGLHFLGYRPTLGGMLRKIKLDSRELAKRV